MNAVTSAIQNWISPLPEPQKATSIREIQLIVNKINPHFDVVIQWVQPSYLPSRLNSIKALSSSESPRGSEERAIMKDEPVDKLPGAVKGYEDDNRKKGQPDDYQRGYYIVHPVRTGENCCDITPLEEVSTDAQATKIAIRKELVANLNKIQEREMDVRNNNIPVKIKDNLNKFITNIDTLSAIDKHGPVNRDFLKNIFSPGNSYVTQHHAKTTITSPPYKAALLSEQMTPLKQKTSETIDDSEISGLVDLINHVKKEYSLQTSARTQIPIAQTIEAYRKDFFKLLLNSPAIISIVSRKTKELVDHILKEDNNWIYQSLMHETPITFNEVKKNLSNNLDP